MLERERERGGALEAARVMKLGFLNRHSLNSWDPFT